MILCLYQLQSIETSCHDGDLVSATNVNDPPLHQGINNSHYNLQPQEVFAGGMLPVTGPSMYPNSNMQQTDPSAIIPVVSEYFEWDLANLWNFDVGPTQERM